MNHRLLLSALLCLLLLALAGCRAAVPTSTETNPPSTAATDDSAPQLTAREGQTATSGGLLRTRAYPLENGDEVQFGSLCAETDLQAGTVLYTTAVRSGTLHLYTPELGWQTLLLTEGTYSATLLVLDGQEGSWMAYLPQSWELLENVSRRYLDCGTLRVQAVPEGFELSLCAPAMGRGNVADFTVVQAPDARLLDWAYPNCEALWSGYSNSGDGRWCYDGYYWPAPSTYLPHGKQVYYRMPLPYLCRSFLGVASVYRLADDLAPCMIDTMLLQQNELGFFPTYSESTWLSEDYKIPSGFYDTRFNTELAEILNNAWARYQFPQFGQALQRYAAFFVSYAEAHHRETTSGGWFVDDYYHPSGNLPTHTSLNHQLAEILLLYHLSDSLQDPQLSALADRMLLAITDTTASWIQPNSNLHYAVYPDGSYGGLDYPYLTYNDLYAVQKELEARRGSRDPGLDRLMANKKLWMDANGITGYRS